MPPLLLAPEAASAIRLEIERASGREVCFLAGVSDRIVVEPRAVARGNRQAVLAVARDAPQGGLLVHNHPSGDLEPSDADLAVAARCWEEGLGTAIVDNEATRLYVVVEPPDPRSVELLDPEEIEALVSPGGALSTVHPDFEDREGQRRMLRLVVERYNEGGVQLVEAGTGTGKSLAYLLPAAAWALKNRERTVISTATINLQEQLVAKDLPLVRTVLGEDLQWALVKGRGNYVSIRRARLAAVSADTLFEDDRSAELSAILDWIRTTEDGSRSDLTFTPSEEAWDEVRSDPDVCLRSRCPHFQECFYQRSRRRAGAARLVVVNHHLLFTDLAVRRATGNYTQAAVLPPYDRVVLDEAHNVEDAATSHLGVEVTRSGLFRLLARLHRGEKGILTAVHQRLADAGSEAESLRRRIDERLRPDVDAARESTSAFVDVVESILPDQPNEALRIGGADGLREPVEDERVREALDSLLGALSGLEHEVEALRRRIELSEPLEELLEERLLDLQSLARRLGAAQFSLRLVLLPTEEEARSYVRWIDVRGRGRRANLVMAAAPIEVGPLLEDSLFTRTETSILTSATLTTRGSFDFLRSRLGLGFPTPAQSDKKVEINESIILSPFDFTTQTRLLVPTDLPHVHREDEALQEATARVTEAVAEATGGGLFVLFTSHRALGRVSHHLRERGTDRRWPLFVQGEASRSALIGDFITANGGILLGTASFWEGVDVPGRPLRGIIIQKLPFRVPSQPVTAARLEAVERNGGRPFWDYMLPLAALKLKQGFGRLVRSREDRGAVLILDDRVVRKRYGAYLRDSLPPAPLVKGPWAVVETRLRDFYAGI